MRVEPTCGNLQYLSTYLYNYIALDALLIFGVSCHLFIIIIISSSSNGISIINLLYRLAQLSGQANASMQDAGVHACRTFTWLWGDLSDCMDKECKAGVSVVS